MHKIDRIALAALFSLALAPAADAQPWSTNLNGPYTSQSVGVGQGVPGPAPGIARLFVRTSNQSAGVSVFNYSALSQDTFGVRAAMVGTGGTGNRYAIFGTATGAKSYAGFFVGRGYFQGPLAIGTAPSSALVEIGDLYTAGGKNLLIGNDAFFTDIDAPSVLGLYGNQDSTRAGLQLGSGGILLSGYQGNLGVGALNPAERLQLGDRFTFHDGGTKVLGLNFAYKNNADVRLVPGGVATLRFDIDGSLKLSTAPPGAAGSTIVYPSGVRLTSDGRLGVGTDTPAERLEVNGNIKLAGDIVSDGDICIGNCP